MVFYGIFLRADELSDDYLFKEIVDSPVVIISLGSNCTPALFLRDNNLRFGAFPFDWCLTSFIGLCKQIESDFNEFFNLEGLICSRLEHFDKNMYDFIVNDINYLPQMSNVWVYDRKNGMIFNHDFTNNDMETIWLQHSMLYEKYQRRIRRFEHVMTSNKRIILIRYGDINRDQAVALTALLRSKFPRSNFVLLVADAGAEFEDDWKIPGIKNYKTGDSCISQMVTDIIAEQKLVFDLPAQTNLALIGGSQKSS